MVVQSASTLPQRVEEGQEVAGGQAEEVVNWASDEGVAGMGEVVDSPAAGHMGLKANNNIHRPTTLVTNRAVVEDGQMGPETSNEEGPISRKYGSD